MAISNITGTSTTVVGLAPTFSEQGGGVSATVSSGGCTTQVSEFYETTGGGVAPITDIDVDEFGPCLNPRYALELEGGEGAVEYLWTVEASCPAFFTNPTGANTTLLIECPPGTGTGVNITITTVNDCGGSATYSESFFHHNPTPNECIGDLVIAVPNPASDVVTIIVEEIGGVSPPPIGVEYPVVIKDFNGNTMTEMTTENHQATTYLDGYLQGIYYVFVNTSNQIITTNFVKL